MDTKIFSDFAKFWHTAQLPIPIVIVGGGRWGKVWASVVMAARRGSARLSIAARTDCFAVQSWANKSDATAGILVCNSIPHAVSLMPGLKAAIICSRPRDHLNDTLEAFDHGLHVLVEKPISIHSAHAIQMIEKSLQVNRKLAIGTEFAFLPAVHQCVLELGLSVTTKLKATLYWDDIEGESRYSATKVRHPEVDYLSDLLPHAFSIFRTLLPSNNLNILSAYQDLNSNKGHIRFGDAFSNDFLLTFNLVSNKRRRVLEILSGADLVVIDFSTSQSVISLNGFDYPINSVFQPLTSTLRLQLGAFFSEIDTQTEFILDPAIQSLVNLQMDLERLNN